MTFWDHVEKTKTCWIWMGCKFSNGYGRVRLSPTKTVVAHRMAWQMTRGEIPAGMMVCHKCDVRDCCNPAHLFLGNARDNVRDCMKKGRRASNVGENHPSAKLTEQKVLKIRQGRLSGIPLSVFAKKYGVTIQAVSLASNGASWSHI